MKDFGPDDKTVQLFNKELILYIQSLNKDDEEVDIIWIILAFLIFPL